MASTNGYGQPNSMEELERDAERTRADLAHTVDEIRSRISDTASDIRERVSPAAIKQDVKDYVHQSGQQLYHTIETRARENPLQTVAIAAGLAYPVWRIVSSMPVPVLLIGAGIALSNRGVLMTPFHNMALMSPATTSEDVATHLRAFDAAVAELTG